MVIFLCLSVYAYRTRQNTKLVLTMIAGSIMGLVIDVCGVYMLNMWYYPRQPIFTLEYLVIVIPCWGVFVSLVNILWDIVKQYRYIWVCGLGMVVYAFYEGLNIYTTSWHYNEPMWFVTLGWIVLIMATRYSYLCLAYILEAIKEKGVSNEYQELV